MFFARLHVPPLARSSSTRVQADRMDTSAHFAPPVIVFPCGQNLSPPITKAVEVGRPKSAELSSRSQVRNKHKSLLREQSVCALSLFYITLLLEKPLISTIYLLNAGCSRLLSL